MTQNFDISRKFFIATIHVQLGVMVRTERLEKRLANEIKYGIARAFHEKGKAPKWIAAVMGIKRNSVGGTINCIADLNRMPPWLYEEIVQVVDKVNDNKGYVAEFRRLVKLATSKSEDESKVNESKILAMYRRLYATGMANLWCNSIARKPAEIFYYQPKVVSPRETLEGKFWRLPEGVLPQKVRALPNAKRPYLGLNFDDNLLRLCDEDAGTIKVKVIGIPKIHSKKIVVPELASLSSESVKKICFEYFRRHNYDVHQDVKQQIEKRYKDEIAPAVMRAHIQLLLPNYNSSGRALDKFS